MIADKHDILLLEGIHPVAKENLEKHGFKVDLLKGALPEAELIERLAKYSVVGIRSKTQLKSQVLEKAKHLHAIGAFCIGTNQIDLKVACQQGTPVFNAPHANTRSVAELVIAEIISLSRHLGDRNTSTHQGLWNKSAHGSFEIRGKKLGIVGYGHIGSQVSILAEAMGLQVYFYDIAKKLPLGNAVACESLRELLQIADFVTLHVPETPSTSKMMGSRELSLMKKGSYLINASRGTVVVIPELVKKLKTGDISGAAIDVFPKEPRSSDEAFESELQGLSNVILTPHIGGSTEEAQEKIGIEVAESLKAFLRNGTTANSVNFPKLDPPALDSGYRIANIHRNIPGVMGRMNQIVSDLGANIRAQRLETNQDIGYMVMDIEQDVAHELCRSFTHLDTSIKTWMLAPQQKLHQSN